MSYQTGRNILVAFGEEDTFGELATQVGGSVFRANSGTLNLNKTPIRSGENRRDGQMTRGRHGQRDAQGGYLADLSVGTFDALFEAVMRGTWEAALVITEATASLTSITTGANTIVAGGGSWITAGIRVGDVIRLTGHSSAGNNSRNLRVTAVTASTLTVAETLTVNAVADTAFTVTRPRKLIQGTTARSFTFEEREIDIDGSEIFTGVRVGQLRVQMQPNSMVTVYFGCVGQDMEVMTAGDSPYFASPAATATLGLTVVECAIRLGSADIVDLTGLDLTFDLKAAGTGVVGSVVTPDVFTNQSDVTLNITALRQDLTRVASFLNEDELSLHLLCVENDSEPKDFVSFVIPNLTLASSSKSELGQDGPRSQTLGCLVGADDRGSQYDATTLKIQTSAA